MGTIFRKTPKGSSEIETRVHRLAPRIRSVLILVDGRRSDDELCQMVVQQCDESLQALLTQGFIEETARTVGARPGQTAAPIPAPAPVLVPAPAASASASPQDFGALRRDAVRHLNDQVGPMAEALAIRMERARDVAELRPLLDTAAQVIGNVRGASAAAAFSARFRAG